MCLSSKSNVPKPQPVVAPIAPVAQPLTVPVIREAKPTSIAPRVRTNSVRPTVNARGNVVTARSRWQPASLTRTVQRDRVDQVRAAYHNPTIARLGAGDDRFRK